MTTPEVVIYGASGHANAVRCALETQGLARVVAFIDDFRGEDGIHLAGRPVISFARWRNEHPARPCLIAIADTAAKRRLAARVAQAGGAFCHLYDTPGHPWGEVAIGAGSLIVAPAYIGPNTRIGAHVVVMPMSSVGHDVTIGDHVTICPSCTIGGQVEVESGAFIGAGSTIINGTAERPLVVGAGATVAAGAVVTKSVAPGTTVMGNPARSLRSLAAERKMSSGA